MSERQLNPPPNTPSELTQDEISNLWWDERTKVGMMADKHIVHALNKLQGLGKDKYNTDDHTRTMWIIILRREQIRREESRRATKIDSPTQ